MEHEWVKDDVIGLGLWPSLCVGGGPRAAWAGWNHCKHAGSTVRTRVSTSEPHGPRPKETAATEHIKSDSKRLDRFVDRKRRKSSRHLTKSNVWMRPHVAGFRTYSDRSISAAICGLGAAPTIRSTSLPPL